MRIALTGSTGFIGRHVVKSLMDRGHQVVEILRPGRREAARTRTFVEFELESPPRDAFECLGSPEVLVHLAWAGVREYDSPHHVESELPRHAEFLRALAGQGLPRIVVAGTCFEYGLREGQIREIHPVAPVTEYARAKTLLHERLLRMNSGADIIWARLFYPYGPGQAPESLFGQFHRACESGAGFFPMSPGDQLRDYLAIAEMADYIAEISAANRAGHMVANVGSGRPITVRNLVERWAAEYGVDIELRAGVYAYPEHEPRNAWANTEVLKSFLGQHQRDEESES